MSIFEYELDAHPEEKENPEDSLREALTNKQYLLAWNIVKASYSVERPPEWACTDLLSDKIRSDKVIILEFRKALISGPNYVASVLLQADVFFVPTPSRVWNAMVKVGILDKNPEVGGLTIDPLIFSGYIENICCGDSDLVLTYAEVVIKSPRFTEICKKKMYGVLEALYTLSSYSCKHKLRKVLFIAKLLERNLKHKILPRFLVSQCIQNESDLQTVINMYGVQKTYYLFSSLIPEKLCSYLSEKEQENDLSKHEQSSTVEPPPQCSDSASRANFVRVGLEPLVHAPPPKVELKLDDLRSKVDIKMWLSEDGVRDPKKIRLPTSIKKSSEKNWVIRSTRQDCYSSDHTSSSNYTSDSNSRCCLLL
jgi:hypothetical protein